MKQTRISLVSVESVCGHPQLPGALMPEKGLEHVTRKASTASQMQGAGRLPTYRYKLGARQDGDTAKQRFAPTKHSPSEMSGQKHQ